MGPLPAQPRRADARDGHRRGARLHVRGVREGPADEAQPRHPPPARAAARQRPRRDRADARDPLLAAGFTRPLLRRRDRDGRQRLPRRPRRRAHADAVDRRPQRRLLARRLRAALPAAADGPGLRLPGGQRRGAAAHADLAAALAAALHRAAQGAPGVRARHLRAAPGREHADLRPHPALRGRRSSSASTTSRARRRRWSSTSPTFAGHGPGGDARSTRFPPIGELPYLLTLAPRGFFWFQLRQERAGASEPMRRAAADRVRDPAALVRREVADGLALGGARHRHDPARLEPRCRSRSSRCASTRERTTSTSSSSRAGTTARRSTALAEDAGIAREIVSAMRAGLTPARLGGRGRVQPGRGLLRARAASSARCGSSASEQSNTSVVFDDALILKVYRRLEPGINPELEMLRFLDRARLPRTSRRSAAGTRTRRAAHGARSGSLQEFVAGAVDGWELALERDRLARPRASSTGSDGSAR